MRTIDDYCDLAKRRNNLTSDRQLARVLQFKGPIVSFWRSRKAWPSDAAMIRLAELAGIPPEEALIDLNLWRSDDPTTRSLYLRIAEKLRRSAVAFLVAVFAAALFTPSSADAPPNREHFSVFAPKTMQCDKR